MSVASLLTIIGRGNNKSIKVSGGPGPVTLLTFDLATGVVTTANDSSGNPFFTPADQVNLTMALQQLLAVISPADQAAAVIGMMARILAIGPLDANTVTCGLTNVGDVYSFNVTTSAATAYVGVQVPHSIDGMESYAALGGGPVPTPPVAAPSLTNQNARQFITGSGVVAVSLPVSTVDIVGTAGVGALLPQAVASGGAFQDGGGFLFVNNSGPGVSAAITPNAADRINLQAAGNPLALPAGYAVQLTADSELGGWFASAMVPIAVLPTIPASSLTNANPALQINDNLIHVIGSFTTPGPYSTIDFQAAAGAAATVVLPQTKYSGGAFGLGGGYLVTNVSGNTVTITPNAADQINLQGLLTSISLPAGYGIILTADGNGGGWVAGAFFTIVAAPSTATLSGAYVANGLAHVSTNFDFNAVASAPKLAGVELLPASGPTIVTLPDPATYHLNEATAYQVINNSSSGGNCQIKNSAGALITVVVSGDMCTVSLVTASANAWQIQALPPARSGVTIADPINSVTSGGAVSPGAGGEEYPTGAPFTRTLADATTFRSGASFIFKNLIGSGGNVTLNTTGGQTIDGSATSITVFPGQCVWLMVTVSGNWIVVATSTVSFQKGIGTLRVNVVGGAGTAVYDTLVSTFSNQPIQVTNVNAWKDNAAGGAGDTGIVQKKAGPAPIYSDAAGAPISMATTVANQRIKGVVECLNVTNGLLATTDTLEVSIVETTDAGGTWFVEFYSPAP
jgi:hypothetical protein